MSRHAIVALALLLIPAAAACNRAGSDGSAARPRIALVLKTMNSPFFIDMQRGAERAAAAIDDARTAIAAGTLLATVAQYPGEMGRSAVAASLKAIEGEAIAPDITVRIGLATKEKGAR